MLQIAMRRFLVSFLTVLAVGLSAQAQTSAHVNGLIIQLKPGAQAQFSRELPSAAQAMRENLAHSRMSLIAQGAGLQPFTHRQMSGDHRLIRLPQP